MAAPVAASTGTSPTATVGQGVPVATAAAVAAQASANAACLLGFPGVTIPIVGNTGSFCLLSKAEARGFIGSLCLVGGGVLFVVGALIVAASAFESSGAGRVVRGLPGVR